MEHILITGANRGLGLEFTRQYLERGAHIWRVSPTCGGGIVAQLASQTPTKPVYCGPGCGRS